MVRVLFFEMEFFLSLCGIYNYRLFWEGSLYLFEYLKYLLNLCLMLIFLCVYFFYFDLGKF